MIWPPMKWHLQVSCHSCISWLFCSCWRGLALRATWFLADASGCCAGVKDCLDRAAGPECHGGPGTNSFRRDEFDTISRSNRSHDENGFEHCKYVANAAARAAAEGEVRVGRARFGWR